jgi:hypothetical protein
MLNGGSSFLFFFFFFFFFFGLTMMWKKRDDGLYYHATVLEVCIEESFRPVSRRSSFFHCFFHDSLFQITGDSYTVVFLEYGNLQPATLPEHMCDNMKQSFSEVGGSQTPKKTPASQITSSALDQLKQLDSQIEMSAESQKAETRPNRSGTRKIVNAPLPPAPPPPPSNDPAQAALSHQQAARAKSRIDLAALLLGVAPTRPEELEEVAVTGPFFGIELRDLYVRDGTAVPKVLVDAGNELRKRAHVEGIFRIPGRANVVGSMVEAADKGQVIDLEKQETGEIASFLKKFFALLPASVIPSDLVDRFGKAHNDTRTLCSELRQLVDQALPVERAEVLNFTLDLLNYIAKRSEQNKMTSKNLATVFLPALFFSVQGDATSPEEIMKMAVLGFEMLFFLFWSFLKSVCFVLFLSFRKAVSQTLSFMIDNPKLDPDNIVELAKSASTVAIAHGASTSSPQLNASTKASRSGSTQSHPGSPATSLKKGSRKRSTTHTAGDLLVPASSDGKLSAESVLAAMRKAKDRMERRAGTFGSGDGSFFIGKRGWMTVAKKAFWFQIVNDWLYWFKEEHSGASSSPAVLSALLNSFSGNVLMSRCNVISRRPQEIEVISPTGPVTVLTTDSQRDCEDWLFRYS